MLNVTELNVEENRMSLSIEKLTPMDVVELEDYYFGEPLVVIVLGVKKIRDDDREDRYVVQGSRIRGDRYEKPDEYEVKHSNVVWLGCVGTIQVATPLSDNGLKLERGISKDAGTKR